MILSAVLQQNPIVFDLSAPPRQQHSNQRRGCSRQYLELFGPGFRFSILFIRVLSIKFIGAGPCIGVWFGLVWCLCAVSRLSRCAVGGVLVRSIPPSLLDFAARPAAAAVNMLSVFSQQSSSSSSRHLASWSASCCLPVCLIAYLHVAVRKVLRAATHMPGQRVCETLACRNSATSCMHLQRRQLLPGQLRPTAIGIGTQHH